MPSIGKISGLCADYSKSTLNGRPYDKIYERMLNGQDFRFNEMMRRGGIPCELGHPTDFGPDGVPRTETDPSKIAVILTKIEKGGPQKLVAEGDIMDTPNGRIFKTLSEFYTFGLSSRGSYEVDENSPIEGPDGWNQDSYVFKGYDLVLLPSNSISELSVTEGLASTPNRVVKVVRESIDVNRLAEASNVSEDQVNEALDQLFNIDDKVEKSKEISMSEVSEELDLDKTPEEVDTENQEVIEDDDLEETEPTLITDGDEVEKIKADLQKALEQIEDLVKKREEDGIELSNRNAEITKLTSDKEGLQLELDERISESEELMEKFEALQSMSSKLLESYRKAKEIFEKGQEGPTEKEEELSSELEKAKFREKQANESLEQTKKLLFASRKETLAAKESLIGLYSTSLGISQVALKSTLGKQFQVKDIKAAAESLAQTAARYSARPVIPVVSKRASATESFQAQDEVERDLLALMKNL